MSKHHPRQPEPAIDKPTAAALDALNELTVTLGWLAATLLPGTAKPYHAPQMSEEARIARAFEDRAYREAALNSGQVPLGASPAPMDLNVLDLLSEILTAADEIADQCFAALDKQPAVPVAARPLSPASSAFADPGPFLGYATRNLPAACTADGTLAKFVEDKCDGLTMRAHAQLGILGDGQVLHTVCPWCDGRSGGRFGQETMQVRAALPVGKRSVIGVRPSDVRWLVVCYGVNCTPAADEVGEWWRERPAWPLKTWSTWLADRLESARMMS